MPSVNKLSVTLTVTVLALPCGAALYYWWHRRKQRVEREAVDRKREDQGCHECEVMGSSQSEAMESEWLWKRCTKNPGHPSFIPAADFSLDHLPSPYRDAAVYQLVKNVSSRTVRLRVNYTSPARPGGYPFSNCGGKAIQHTGTGWVRDLHVCQGPCKCPECVGKEVPYTRWWLVRIHTACHVVFDTTEARATLVDVFFDSETAEIDGDMVTMVGLRVIVKNEDQDLCRFYGVTHDENLVNRLQVYTKQWEKTPTTLVGNKVWEENHAPLCVVVSHPHGQAKCITVGRCEGHSEQNEIGECAHLYSTATCKGSSGAPVIFPRRLAVGGDFHWVPTMYPHSGTSENGLNQSAVGGVRSY